MRLLRSSMCVLLMAALSACTGDTGPEGPAGPEGPTGPEGPIAAPPILTGLTPAWGSAMTAVTISGESFSATPAENRVTFNGWDAEVVSATATELIVRPMVATEDARPVVVNVEVANQVSNGLFFELVPSGTTRATPIAVPTAPSGVARVGTDLYVAAGSVVSPSAGLYRVGVDGTTTQVVAGRRFEAAGAGPTQIFDGPVAVATDGTDVFFTTVLGAVRKYSVAEGGVTDVVAPGLGGGSAFPARTALAFDGAGNLYVLDRNGAGDGLASILRVATDGSVHEVADVGGAGYGLASDGTNLFATRGNGVVKVTSPAGTPVLTAHSAGGPSPALGLAVVGGNVVASFQSGILGAVSAGTPGAMTPFGDGGGYGYGAQGMAATTSGDLYLAQADASAVRVIPNGQTAATIVAAGTRLAFGTARIGTTWYFATVGSGLFSGGPGGAPAAPDGAIIEVRANGTSRVLRGGGLPIDLLATGADQLTISDCLTGEIYTLVPSTGVATTVLDDGDGIVCPAGMYAHASGDLFFLEAALGPGTATIGKVTSGGTLTQDVVTGLPGPTLFLDGIGDDLYAAGLGLSDDNVGTGVWHGDAATAGAATRVASDASTGGTTAMTVGPDDRIFMHRFALGELIELDPSTGELAPIGTTLIDGLFSFGSGSGSVTFSMGFGDDGTIVLMDMGQSTLAAVAP